mgnify:CR=1 FL=1
MRWLAAAESQSQTSIIGWVWLGIQGLMASRQWLWLDAMRRDLAGLFADRSPETVVKRLG